jgi:hypothetical protein
VVNVRIIFAALWIALEFLYQQGDDHTSRYDYLVPDAAAQRGSQGKYYRRRKLFSLYDYWRRQIPFSLREILVDCNPWGQRADSRPNGQETSLGAFPTTAKLKTNPQLKLSG